MPEDEYWWLQNRRALWVISEIVDSIERGVFEVDGPEEETIFCRWHKDLKRLKPRRKK